MNIKSLKEKEQELRKQISDYQASRKKELLPKYRKQYIGKCYKCRNSYGGDIPKWWLYSKIVDVTSVNFHNEEEPVFKTLNFQHCYMDKIEIEVREYVYVRSPEYKSVSAAEFNKAARKLMQRAKEYLSL